MNTTEIIITGLESIKAQYGSNKVVTVMAYLLGVSEKALQEYYDPEVLAKLEQNVTAKIVRCLCMLRMVFLTNYEVVERDLKQNFRNIDKQTCFDQKIVKFLIANSTFETQCNSGADGYLVYITHLIKHYIPGCASLFSEDIKFNYIKKLFVPTAYNTQTERRQEAKKFFKYRNCYPYGMYLNWVPKEQGNILLNDGKFLEILYRQNKDEFKAGDLYHDISSSIKSRIDSFMEEAGKAVMVVDCENVDPYKLYAVVSQMADTVKDKLTEIILFDDVNSSPAWDYFGSTLNMKVRHIETNRVLKKKSIVDMKLALEVHKMCYQGTDTVILCSSDSDFCPLIEDLPEVRFMVLYEYSKCSNHTKYHWKDNEVFFLAIDEFYLGEASKLKTVTLVTILKNKLPEFVGKDSMFIAEEVFRQAKVVGDDEEKKKFCDRYVKKAKIYIDDKGVLVVAA